MIDGMVAEALKECNWKKRGEFIELEVRTFPTDSEFLVRELFITLWRAADWPLQAMGLHEWQSLVDLLNSPKKIVRTLPGGVVAKKEGGKLSLHRPE